MGRYTDIAKTLNSYFNKFCPSYAKGVIPKDKQKPYLTYTVSDTAEFEDNIIQVMVYGKGKSLLEVSEIVDKIEIDLKNGITISAIGSSFSTIYLRKGSPFAQHLNDDSTGMAVYINIIQKIL